ncbi:MAG: hypothetical protein COA77_07235 [Thaumarchaeota archaeon]|nr:MAG: hypothetical protein COA77_07235 [Nitrososphaerota archaeon]
MIDCMVKKQGLLYDHLFIKIRISKTNGAITDNEPPNKVILIISLPLPNHIRTTPRKNAPINVRIFSIMFS